MKRGFKCNVDGCARIYTTQSNLNAHLREDHRSNAHLHTCNTCELSFKRGTYLKRHQLVHAPESSWPFVCPTCSKACPGRRDNFARHVRSCAPKTAQSSPPSSPGSIVELLPLRTTRRERRTVVSRADVNILEGFLRLPLVVSVINYSSLFIFLIRKIK